MAGQIENPLFVGSNPTAACCQIRRCEIKIFKRYRFVRRACWTLTWLGVHPCPVGEPPDSAAPRPPDAYHR